MNDSYRPLTGVSRRGFLQGVASLGAMQLFAGNGGKLPPIRIAHCCDPQLGFGPVGKGKEAYKNDLARAEKEIEKVNELQPDICFFGGDMVNKWNELSQDWPRLLKRINVPWIVVPGNHDIPDDRNKTQRDLFTSVFGYVYTAQTVKGWRLIAANGQFERAPGRHPSYHAWRNRELEEAKKAGLPIIWLTHQPPFDRQPDEKDSYQNYPLATRHEFLDRCLDSGVRFFLAGHTHRTQNRTYWRTPLLNAETTSRNFDKRPHGFRMLEIPAEGPFKWEFVPV